ncbi:hypothetical protein DOT_2838 [Desulfosporosinus sp. OT]|nr:hypothetical protein DOT_2838 [Desulfosporosinus sp. OT]
MQNILAVGFIVKKRHKSFLLVNAAVGNTHHTLKNIVL